MPVRYAGTEAPIALSVPRDGVAFVEELRRWVAQIRQGDIVRLEGDLPEVICEGCKTRA